MEEKTLWGITKTRKSDDILAADILAEKYWLNISRDLWVYEPTKRSVAVAAFDNQWEARKALNKKLSFELKNWGMEHVKLWKYKVEELNK